MGSQLKNKESRIKIEPEGGLPEKIVLQVEGGEP